MIAAHEDRAQNGADRHLHAGKETAADLDLVPIVRREIVRADHAQGAIAPGATGAMTGAAMIALHAKLRVRRQPR
jgi:hypothetical protein